MRLRDRSGFTIFELLVVLVLIGIIFAFAYPRISKVAATASLRGARGAMITALNVAKSSAITSGKCSSLTVVASAVTVYTAPCNGGTNVEVVSNRNFGIDYGVVLTVGGAATDTIRFDPRGIPLSPISKTYTVTKGGDTRSVTVGSYGRIQ